MWSKSLSRKRKTNAIWYHLHVEPNTWHKWTYPWNRNQLTDIENRPVVAKRRRGGRGKDWESGINICKLLFIKWINNKVLSHSRERYSISYNKPQRKRILYNMNHFAVQQKLTHYKSTIIQCLCGSHTTWTVWSTTNWKIPKEMGRPHHLICLLSNLYADQEATVRTRNGTMN